MVRMATELGKCMICGKETADGRHICLSCEHENEMQTFKTEPQQIIANIDRLRVMTDKELVKLLNRISLYCRYNSCSGCPMYDRCEWWELCYGTPKQVEDNERRVQRQEVAHEKNLGCTECRSVNNLETAEECYECEQEYKRLAMLFTELTSYRATDTGFEHWIPCSERLPSDTTCVLVTDGENMAITNYHDGDWDYHDMYGNHLELYCGITHWMPLPQAPNMNNDE